MMTIETSGETTVQVKRRLEAGFKALRNKRVGEFLRMLIQQTPVDTGQARGGWQVGTSEAEWPLFREDPDGSIALAEGLHNLEAIHHWANVVVSNAEPHIGSLERGHSGQAPIGIVRVVLPAFKDMHGDVK